MNTAISREELRSVVIRTALKLFLKNGVDIVRMDDIASELSVSKRTLYEMFSSKENLLLECMDLHVSMIQQKIAAEISSGNDVLSVTLKLLEMLIAETDRTGCVTFSNLEKYPVFKEKLQQQRESIHEHFRGYLELGIKQGVFRDDICIDILMEAFDCMGQLIRRRSGKNGMKYEVVVYSTIIVLFRGIATKKGLDKIDEYKFKFNNRL